MTSHTRTNRHIHWRVVAFPIALCLLVYTYSLQADAIRHQQQCDGYRVAVEILNANIPPGTYEALERSEDENPIRPITSYEEAMRNLSKRSQQRESEVILEEYWQQRRNLYLQRVFVRQGYNQSVESALSKESRAQHFNRVQRERSDAEEELISTIGKLGKRDVQIEKRIESWKNVLVKSEERYAEIDRWNDEYSAIVPYLQEVPNLELKLPTTRYFLMDLLEGAVRVTPLLHFATESIDQKDFVFHRGCVFFSGIAVASLPPSTNQDAMILGNTTGRALSGLVLLGIAGFIIRKDLRKLLRSTRAYIKR